MPYTKQQDTFIVEVYFRNGQKMENGEWSFSVTLCAEEVIQKFPGQFNVASLGRHINRLVKKFRLTGSIDRRPGGRPPQKLTEQVLQNIRADVVRSPKKSVHRRAQQSGLSYGTMHTAVRKKLRMHPYKISIVQELYPLDWMKSPILQLGEGYPGR